MSGPGDRTQAVRIDCPDCHDRGYLETATGQVFCERCQGSGTLEKIAPYKYETRGVWTKEEKAELFEMNPADIRDAGHDVPSTKGGSAEE